MLTIKNYGHFWSRDLVDWGSRGKGNQGSILGALRSNAEESDADFREQIAIYVLFNGSREVVYIGQTGKGNQRLFSRLRQHARGPMRDRWHNFSWFGFLEADTKSGKLVEAENPEAAVKGSHLAALDEIEAVLMQIVEPRLNKRGPNWKDTIEYYQFSDAEPATLDDLWFELEELKKQLKGSKA